MTPLALLTVRKESQPSAQRGQGKHTTSVMGSSSGTDSAVTEVAAWGIPRGTAGGTDSEMLKVQLEQPAACYPAEEVSILP